MSKKDAKMWDGRFESGMAPSMVELSFSLDFDQEMLAEDIQGTIGHCKGLIQSGVLSEEDFKKVQNGLEAIYADIQGGELVRGDDRAINFKVLLGASDVAVGVHHQSSKLTHRVPRGRASVQIGGQICLAHALALTAALPNRIDKRCHLTRWPRRRRACEGGRRLSR